MCCGNCATKHTQQHKCHRAGATDSKLAGRVLLAMQRSRMRRPRWHSRQVPLVPAEPMARAERQELKRTRAGSTPLTPLHCRQAWGRGDNCTIYIYIYIYIVCVVYHAPSYHIFVLEWGGRFAELRLVTSLPGPWRAVEGTHARGVLLEDSRGTLRWECSGMMQHSANPTALCQSTIIWVRSGVCRSAVSSCAVWRGLALARLT